MLFAVVMFFLSITSLSAIQIHHLSKKEREDTIRFLSSKKGARVWVDHVGFTQVCTIDFRYPSSVYLSGQYLIKLNASGSFPMCPVECERGGAINVCFR
ncbi:MAG: hypothetical protein COB67_07760 [SAR324 cluster bacterium]|uniref:Uncharacterized protein n=1 Tax=SAR324 cluster bacterium TaxID=2024889 RepID=A0A2A4T437_9DELT|nr:MAG: hypothetical protein COB67_07760 [SAR324 cluster bacterium]